MSSPIIEVYHKLADWTGYRYAYLPLLVLFEKEPPEQFSPAFPGQTKYDQASDTALLIPCYKSEKLISATLEAALKVFPAQNIFVRGLSCS